MGIFLKTLRSLFLHVVITLPFVCLLPLSVARVRPGVIVMAHSRKAIVDSPHIATNTSMICSSVLFAASSDARTAEFLDDVVFGRCLP